MQAVVGVVPRDSDAQHIVNALRRIGIPNRHVSVLSPGMRERAIRAVPTTDAEAPGIGGAIGGVVGGAAGTAGGLAVASLVLPGVGPVVAAGAIALGLVGALAGGTVGSRLDDALSKGLPTDELYVYRDALRKGRSLVIVTTDVAAQATQVRELLTSCGAESVNAARDAWWLGLRDAEEAEYTGLGGDFRRTRRSTARASTPRRGSARACPPTMRRALVSGIAAARPPRRRRSARATSEAAGGDAAMPPDRGPQPRPAPGWRRRATVTAPSVGPPPVSRPGTASRKEHRDG